MCYLIHSGLTIDPSMHLSSHLSLPTAHLLVVYALIPHSPSRISSILIILSEKRKMPRNDSTSNSLITCSTCYSSSSCFSSLPTLVLVPGTTSLFHSLSLSYTPIPTCSSDNRKFVWVRCSTYVSRLYLPPPPPLKSSSPSLTLPFAAFLFIYRTKQKKL